MNIENKLMSIQEVNTLIHLGRSLVIAGDETLLRQLDLGNWIGGTIPYFMDKNGGSVNHEEVFVTDFTDVILQAKIESYDNTQISSTMLEDRYANGFSYVLLPGFSTIHQTYALETGEVASLFDVPVMGWITGVHLDDIGVKTPKVFDGKTGEVSENKACVMHCSLKKGSYAELDIVNIYEQGVGDKIEVDANSFSCLDCRINDEPANLADYYIEHDIDVSLPLVANYSGASINVSVQAVKENEREMSFFAPLLQGRTYYVAKPIEDLYQAFSEALPKDTSALLCSCNCILNYVNIQMENKFTGDFRGPFTFGEIAYVLVNQTMVTLSIHND
ncbi:MULTISPECIES: DUF6976 family protein [unclassified Aureispira]|uniref:DUF6976 family protein n=1 Tax=unclassified Aureispira TaxID=2649989 RepID=UPI000696B5B5|nr:MULTISPECIES: hypothetical protein [unclassified Aureispira]WMX15198.1 hypothetical protein QP953_02290 [Aureispira sp. CCB-E]